MTTKERLPIRQGDVILVPVDSIPADAENVTPAEGRVVLALGEATGHAHAFYDGGVRLYQGKAANAPRYLHVVKTTALLRHEEHTTAKVPPGKYLLPQQSEYTPSELRRVVD